MTAPSQPPSQDGLSASALISGVLDLLKRHPIPLLLPLVVLGILGSGGGGGGPGPTMTFDLDDGGPPPWEVLPFLAFFGLVALLIAIVLILLEIAAWLVTTDAALPAAGAGEGEPDLGRSFRRVLDRIGGGLWTGILGAILVFLGLLALIVPGIVMMVGWTPWAAVVLRENRTGLYALGRAWELTRGHRLDLFLVYLAGFAVSIAAGIFVGWLPLIGNILSSAVGGAVVAALAVTGALYYVRRTGAGTAAAAAPPTAPPAEGPRDEGVAPGGGEA